MAQSKILHIEKDASVPGGTADVAGETISYTLAVTNQGNAAIANVVVDDPFTTNEAPVLIRRLQCRRHRPGQSVGCQRDLAVHGQPHGDAGRAGLPGANIVNTATVTGTGATPDTDDASVPVTQSKILHIEKDARFRAARRTRPATSSTTRWR